MQHPQQRPAEVQTCRKGIPSFVTVGIPSPNPSHWGLQTPTTLFLISYLHAKDRSPPQLVRDYDDPQKR